MCIPEYTRIIAELNPLIGFVIFHKWKKIIADFSGPIKAIKLKLDTDMDSWLLYHVYQDQGQGHITLGVDDMSLAWPAVVQLLVFIYSGIQQN